MNKRSLYLLVFCGILGVSPVAVLYCINNFRADRKGNFRRLTPPHSMTLQKKLPLRSGHYYFAGGYGSKIFIVTTELPVQFQQTDTGLHAVKLINLHFPDSTRLYNVQSSIMASNEVLLLDGFKPAVMKTTLPDTVMSIYLLGQRYFLKAVPLSANSFIFQVYDSIAKQNVYVKYRLDSNRFQQNKYLPDKSSDGVFSIDGILHYDPINHQLMYVYFYRNQFDYLDTNLNRVYTGRTLDSNTTAKVEVLMSGNKKSGIVTAASVQVNKGSWIADNRLYIHSIIAGKNDAAGRIKNYDMLDVYTVSSGKYIQSLAAEKFNGENLNDFIVIGDHFYGLYGHTLVDYRIQRVRSDAGGHL